MPRKTAITDGAAPAAQPARSTKTTTPRVKAARHSKTAQAEPMTMAAAAGSTVSEEIPALSPNRQEGISRIAYGYWEARGFQGGDAEEDWLRAEDEYGRGIE